MSKRSSALGSGLFLKVHINWRSQQARLTVEHKESRALIHVHLLGSHNCAGATHFTSAFHLLLILDNTNFTDFVP